MQSKKAFQFFGLIDVLSVSVGLHSQAKLFQGLRRVSLCSIADCTSLKLECLVSRTLDSMSSFPGVQHLQVFPFPFVRKHAVAGFDGQAERMEALP